MILNGKSSRIWRKSVAVFLFFSIGSERLVVVDALSTITSKPSSRLFFFEPIERMTPHQYQQARRSEQASTHEESLFLDRPILIEQALSPDACEEICNRLVTLAGEQYVPVQQKLGDEVFLHECTLLEAFDLMMDSAPENAFFAFVEGLLESTATTTDTSSSSDTISDNNDMFDQIQQPLTWAREAIFKETNGQNETFSTNWFDYFPRGARPTDCVILAGQGATSTFHRDPFEWTGTSLCLEGRKIWRFLKPPPPPPILQKNNDNSLDEWDVQAAKQVDDFLKAYRLESIAWDTTMGSTTGDGNSESDDTHRDIITLSAGWQSDFSLYNKIDARVPSARELSSMDPLQSDALLDQLASFVSPLLVSNIPPLHDGDAAPQIEMYSVVQKPGDLLLIPAHWYHQTYAPEPSLAVASQRCGSHLDAKRVFRHILSQQPDIVLEDVPASLFQSEKAFAQSDPEKMVKLLFDFLMSPRKSAS